MMNPVLIIRHSATEGAGYFADFLDQRAIPWRLLGIDSGDALPASISGYSGLCLMGGAMSVNDALPWIAPELDLIRQAVTRGTPVIGHCLGGQLLAKALGGVVSANPVKEIGWAEVRVTDPVAAADWLGADARVLNVFHWHGETFSVPPGAVRILESAHCTNQAYIVDNRHIGMQCHVEMTPSMIRAWCAHGAAEIAASTSLAVQSPATMQVEIDARTAALHAVADKIYTRWIQGLDDSAKMPG
jgi:GMP synthase-like glutamine amidotransferase